jgi:hypothetical protein
LPGPAPGLRWCAAWCASRPASLLAARGAAPVTIQRQREATCPGGPSMARLGRLAGGDGAVAVADVAVYRRAALAINITMLLCCRCHQPIPLDVPVFRHATLGGVIWTCEPCQTPPPHVTYDWRSWWREWACRQCGRPVLVAADYRGGHWRSPCCGDPSCRKADKLAQARERRASRRPEALCQTCGQHFPPRRTGARFCSSACRQRAYRQRLHAAAA